MNPDLVVSRAYYSDCTLSRIFVPSKASFTGLELPYLGNEPNRSCIEEGYYRYHKGPSPRLKGRIVIWVNNVPKRQHIQLHPANFISDILGCIAVGDGYRDINGDGIPDVTNSSETFNKLLACIPDTGFILFRLADKPGKGVYL